MHLHEHISFCDTMLYSQVRAWGYEPLLVSCESSKGLKQVDEVLRGKTSVVAGPSGKAGGTHAMGPAWELC